MTYVLNQFASDSFLHPDCTVDSGISPDHARDNLRSWVVTTDRELRFLASHPAPKEIEFCEL